jgi:hypothetical protein
LVNKTIPIIIAGIHNKPNIHNHRFIKDFITKIKLPFVATCDTSGHATVQINRNIIDAISHNIKIHNKLNVKSRCRTGCLFFLPLAKSVANFL